MEGRHRFLKQDMGMVCRARRDAYTRLGALDNLDLNLRRLGWDPQRSNAAAERALAQDRDGRAGSHRRRLAAWQRRT